MGETAQRTPNDVVVEVSSLVKRYKETIALDHFNLSIRRGEVFGLLGPNGSGKTTAINCILQLLTYDKGAVRLFGEAMAPTRYDIKRRIGVVPQNLAVFEELTVRENIDYFCALYVSDKHRRRELVDEAISFVGLEGYERFRPKKLSGGLARRLNIACGIAHKPELIILDEPTVAVDPQSRNAILEGILRLNSEGSTIIYTSHYMEEVEEICSRIMIMDKGRGVANGTNAELKAMIGTGEKLRIQLVGDTGAPAFVAPLVRGGADVGADSPAEMEPAFMARIRRLPHTLRANIEGDVLEVDCAVGAHNLADVLAVLKEADVAFGRIYAEPPTLNDVFLEITGTELRD
ncbi:ABC transporter ATP-binding protein [Adlercreutzia sp. ZJ141]|uniref:ABC transporter ATP-binding protein n=1 Tax=Adlercreutzia sp. ZJ141 TaxID=2709406 RepID=UPI0013ED5D74|nr:ABC transporter ATP-binding protein [Adlercreutzia sp. ZJ141]